MRRATLVTSATAFDEALAVAARTAAGALVAQGWATSLLWAGPVDEAPRWRAGVPVGVDLLTLDDLPPPSRPVVGMRPRLVHSWRLFHGLQTRAAELIVFQGRGADAFWSVRARRLGAAFAGTPIGVTADVPSAALSAQAHDFGHDAIDAADLAWCEAEALAAADLAITPGAAPSLDAPALTAPALAVPRPCEPVSVCIAFYRHDRYVPRLLQAFAEIRATHGAEVQLVIVDDGTPASERPNLDAARPALRARGDVVERQVNAGPGAARNTAAALARHSRLLFFDADNVPFSSLLTDLGRALDRTGADSIGAGFGIVPPMEGAPTLDDVVRWHIPPGGSLVASLFDNQLGDTVALVRREVFEALGGFPTELPYPGCEDWRFWFRLIGAGGRHLVHPSPQFYYTDHPGRNAHVQDAHRYSVRSALFDEINGMTRERLAKIARVLAVQAQVTRQR